MPPKSPKEAIKNKNRSFNEGKIISSIFNPVPFDLKLVFNPYLKDEEKYQYLVFKMKEYNKAVLKGQVTDSYEDMVHDRLRSLIATLGNMLTRDVQIEKMNQVFDWFKNQEVLLLKRKDQGAIRYKVTKDHMKETANVQVSPQFMKSLDYKKLDFKNMLPSEEIKTKNLPYIRNWRTTHKQIETPDIRLLEYHHKNLNINHLLQSQQKAGKKPPRVLYPKIPRVKYVKEYEIQQGLPEDAPKVQNDVNNPQTQPTSEIKQGQKPPEGEVKVQKVEQQPVQDLGLGEEPQDQPQQEQEPEDGDKLAPRLKSYIFQPTKQTKEQTYGHKRMNDRYLKIQNDFLRKQSEDAQLVEMMHSWAARKAQLDKQVMKRIQNMGIEYKNYHHSIEDPQKQQQFPIEEAKKYGLSKTFEVKKPKNDVDFSSQGFQLPVINNKSDIYEKSIRRDKLNTLKKKFGKMLNIKDYEDREVTHSMCQVEAKRKDFSQILRKHSKSKERLKQLDQVIGLKEKLASSKVAIDITTLSQSLCAPQDEENLPEGAYPSKNLLSNPFWVQPAKKKKKK